jgi:hypothetical protein
MKTREKAGETAVGKTQSSALKRTLCTEQYRSTTNIMCEAIEDFEGLKKL